MEKIKELDTFINNVINEQNLPYLDVCVNKNYKTIYRHKWRQNNSGNEKIFVYSCTKPIISACAMRLIENGKIDVETPVSYYLPEYANAFVVDANNNKHKAGEIKIKHLLTMTSGLSYDYDTKPFRELLKSSNGKANTEQICNSFIKTPLLFNPGKEFAYGLSLDVFGAIIEKITGNRLSLYVKENVFEPLEMNDSFFSRGDGKEENVMDLYSKSSDNSVSIIECRNNLIFTPNYDSGGAGVVSTVDDFMKFSECLTNGGVAFNGYRLLRPESVEDMAYNHVKEISVNNNFTCIQGQEYGYGYGVRTRIVPTQWGLPIGEFGWDGAAGSFFLCDKRNGITIFIGMHLMNWFLTFQGEHLRIVEQIYKNLLNK